MNYKENHTKLEANKIDKKKLIFSIFLVVIYAIPICFGIYKLISKAYPTQPVPTEPVPEPEPEPEIIYEVSLLNNEDKKLSISKSAVHINENFTAVITLNRSIASKQILPDSLNANDVLCLNNPINFTYKVSEDKYSASMEILANEIKGNITINISLITICEHTTTTKYTVLENRLYGICDNCGEKILIEDKKLESDEFKDKILVASEKSNEDESKEFTMHDISEMQTIISKAKSGTTIDMYFIYGEYELSGEREEGNLVTVNVYGLLSNNGENINAAVDSKCINNNPYPRYYLNNLDLNFNNLIMNGENREGYTFYSAGLFAHNVTYNNCHFAGMHSLYSNSVIFNNCYFDATTHEGDPEYSIYGYNSYDVEFNSCKFLSNGKAMKIYSEGAAPDASYKFTNCEFKIKSPIKDKAAIEVDSTYHENTRYQVYITNCTQEDYKGGLYHDTANNTDFYIDGKHV